MDILSLQQEMARKLKPKRYLHVLGVQFTCASLAMKYKVDIEKAQFAGLLHDCAKYLSDEMLIQECEKNQISLTDIEKSATQLIHSKLGAFYARTLYGVEDEDILSSIAYHTTGRANMTLLEKIVYVADYIEPSRPANKMRGLTEIREVAFEDIDRAIVLITQNTLDYVKETNSELDPASIETLDYYRNLIETR